MLPVNNKMKAYAALALLLTVPCIGLLTSISLTNKGDANKTTRHQPTLPQTHPEASTPEIVSIVPSENKPVEESMELIIHDPKISRPAQKPDENDTKASCETDNSVFSDPIYVPHVDLLLDASGGASIVLEPCAISTQDSASGNAEMEKDFEPENLDRLEEQVQEATEQNVVTLTENQSTISYNTEEDSEDEMGVEKKAIQTNQVVNETLQGIQQLIHQNIQKIKIEPERLVETPESLSTPATTDKSPSPSIASSDADPVDAESVVSSANEVSCLIHQKNESMPISHKTPLNAEIQKILDGIPDAFQAALKDKPSSTESTAESKSKLKPKPSSSSNIAYSKPLFLLLAANYNIKLPGKKTNSSTQQKNIEGNNDTRTPPEDGNEKKISSGTPLESTLDQNVFRHPDTPPHLKNLTTNFSRSASLNLPALDPLPITTNSSSPNAVNTEPTKSFFSSLAQSLSNLNPFNRYDFII